MISLLFSLAAIGAYLFGTTNHYEAIWHYWVLGGLFALFLLVQYLVFRYSIASGQELLGRLVCKYADAYGTTTSGKRFLGESGSSISQALDSAAELAINFGEPVMAFKAIGVSWLYKQAEFYLSEQLKPDDQHALEAEILRIDGQIEHRKHKLSAALAFTLTMYLAIVSVTYFTHRSPHPTAFKSSRLDTTVVSGIQPVTEIPKLVPVSENQFQSNAAQFNQFDRYNRLPNVENSQTKPPAENIMDSQAIKKSLANPEGIVELRHLDGRMIRARILASSKETVIIRRADGREFEVEIEQFDQPSKELIDRYRAAKRR